MGFFRKFLTEQIDSKLSSESELFFESICSIGNNSHLIVKTPRALIARIGQETKLEIDKQIENETGKDNEYTG